MMQAFVDDSSGTANNNRIISLSACLQTYDAWAKFTDLWQQTLQEKPAIKELPYARSAVAVGQLRTVDKYRPRPEGHPSDRRNYPVQTPRNYVLVK